MTNPTRRPRRIVLLATATAVATACATLPAVAPVTPAAGFFAPAVAAAAEVAAGTVKFADFSYYPTANEDEAYEVADNGEDSPVAVTGNSMAVTLSGGAVSEGDTFAFKVGATDGDNEFYGLKNIDGTIELKDADDEKIGELTVSDHVATITFAKDMESFTITPKLEMANFTWVEEDSRSTAEIKLTSADGATEFLATGIWQKQGKAADASQPITRDNLKLNASTSLVQVSRGITPGARDNYDGKAHSYRIRMTIPKKKTIGEEGETTVAPSRWYSECGSTPACAFMSNTSEPTDPDAVGTDFDGPFDITTVDKKNYDFNKREPLEPTAYEATRITGSDEDNYETWEFYFPTIEADRSPSVYGMWIAPYVVGDTFVTDYQWGFDDPDTDRDEIALSYSLTRNKTIGETDGVAEGDSKILDGPLASSKFASEYGKIEAPRTSTSSGSPEATAEDAPLSETGNKWEVAADAGLPEWIGVNTETGEITATPPKDAELKTWKFPVTHTWPDGSTEIVEAAVEIKSIDSDITPEYQGENPVAWTASASVNVTPELIRNFATGAAVMGEFPGLNVTVEADNMKENFGEITVTPDFGYPAGQVQIPVKYTFLDATVATAGATFTVTAGKLTNPEVEVTQGSTGKAPAAMPDIETVDGEDAKTPQELGFTAKVKPGEEVPDWLTFNADDGTFTAAPGYTVAPGEYTIPVVYTKTTGEGDGAATVELESTTTVTVTAATLTYSAAATVKQNGEATIGSLLSDLDLPEDAKATVAADTGAPVWVTVNADGSITVTPGADVTPGTYEVPVVITFGDAATAPESTLKATATVVVAPAPLAEQFDPTYPQGPEIFAGDKATVDGPATGSYPAGTRFGRCSGEDDTLPPFTSVNEETGAVTMTTEFTDPSGERGGNVCATFPDGTVKIMPVAVTVKPAWQNPILIAAGLLGVVGITALAMMPKPAPAQPATKATTDDASTDEVDDDKYDVGSDEAVDDDDDYTYYDDDDYDDDDYYASDSLADTGAGVDGLAAMSLALLLAGAALILGRRRRRI